jgi:hypothetical protein
MHVFCMQHQVLGCASLAARDDIQDSGAHRDMRVSVGAKAGAGDAQLLYAALLSFAAIDAQVLYAEARHWVRIMSGEGQYAHRDMRVSIDLVPHTKDVHQYDLVLHTRAIDSEGQSECDSPRHACIGRC